MSVQEVIVNLLYFLIGSGLIVWTIRAIIKLWLEKDIEKYKWKLSKESIRFSKLYAERGKIIRDLYYKLFDFEQAMASFVSPMQLAGEKPMKEKRKITAETGNEFRDFYRRNKIYFSKRVSDILGDMDKIFTESWIDFTTFEIYDPESRTLKPTEKMENWVKVWDKIRIDIPQLRNQLEKEFRQILGADIN